MDGSKGGARIIRKRCAYIRCPEIKTRVSCTRNLISTVLLLDRLPEASSRDINLGFVSFEKHLL